MKHFFHEIDVDRNSSIDYYKLTETISLGPFTSVVLGYHLLTMCKVAVKIIHERDYIKVHRNIKRELRCRKDLHHPHIIQLYHVISAPDALFLVMELAPNGNLQDHLRAQGRMPEALARKLFRQLVSALHYCHTKGVAHRNLDPQNVLLDWRMDAKVVDFGFAASFKEHELSMFCGNPLAAPPELFQEQVYDGPAMDMWGLGVLLYKMLTDTYPFTGKNLDELKLKVLKAEYVVPPYLSSGATNLLKKLIVLNPKGRKSLQNIMPDPWLNEGYEEELEPYAEPCRDEIDPWVARKMLQLDFPWQDIKDTSNKNNFFLATYYILKAKRDELQAGPVKATASYPSGIQSRSPSPTAEAGTSTPELSPDSRTATLELIPGSKTAKPVSRPESRTTARERSRGSRTATRKPIPGSKSAKPVSRPDSVTTSAEHRPWYKTATPKQGFRVVSHELNPRIKLIVPDSSPESMTSTLEPSVNSHSQESLCLTADSPSTRQDFRSVTRRSLDFLRGLCCLPPTKGPCRSNQVEPL